MADELGIPAAEQTDVSGFDSETEEQTHQLLLGRPCAPEAKQAVVHVLATMSEEDRRLVYDWSMHPVDELVILAYDKVKNYRAFDRERSNPVAQAATTSYLDEIIDWLELIKTSEQIPVLEYVEPEDGVGEEIDYFVWVLEDGGVNDGLLAEQLEYLQKHLNGYKDYVLDKVRMIRTPDGVGSILSGIPEETKAEREQKEAKRFANTLIHLAEILVPHKKRLDEMLESLGIDPAQAYGSEAEFCD